jgi:hypothetical protein
VDREGEGEFHRTDFLRASALGRYVKAFVCRKMPLQFTTRTGTPRLETSYKAISRAWHGYERSAVLSATISSESF